MISLRIASGPEGLPPAQAVTVKSAHSLPASGDSGPHNEFIGPRGRLLTA